MENVKSVPKKFRFFWRKLAEKKWRKISHHAAQLNGRIMGAEKIKFKEMKRRGMWRMGKKRNHFDVSLCE